MTCAGCGSALPAGSGRGRPARYHNATCRQRARRARLAAGNGAVLDAVAAVESATSAVRRAVLSGESPDETGHRLLAAAAALAGQLGLSGSGSPAAPGGDRRVTKSVTLPSDQAESARPAPSVTESVTETVSAAKGARPAPRRARSAAPAPLDLDTVRQERSTDPIRPGWRVVAGPADAPMLVGFLEPVYSVTGRRSGRWEARTERLTLVSGGPWPNRDRALANLVAAYQRMARNMSRNRLGRGEG